MADYPLVERFLTENPFAPNHAAHDFDLSNPIVPALEYFLSLDAVPGHAGKLKDITNKPVGTPRTNNREIQWASLCAEFGAICLLGKTLGLEIVGFDQVSPRSSRPNANCDIVAVVNGENKYFEVKRNAAEDKQTLPELLEQRLEQLQREISFGMTPELVDRNYDCTDLDEKFCRLKDHVAQFQQQKDQGHRTGRHPPGFRDTAFEVLFHEKGTLAYEGGHYFSPVDFEALAKKLRGPGGTGRDGGPMIPMVKQAAEKGGDYLVCRVPKWGHPWSEIVGKIFDPFSHDHGVTYLSKDPRLNPLEGVVLLAQYDDFCIVNNLRAKTWNWLAA